MASLSCRSIGLNWPYEPSNPSRISRDTFRAIAICCTSTASHARATSNNYAAHGKLLPNCPLKGRASHGKGRGVNDLKADAPDQGFNLFWLPHKIEMIRHGTVCRNIDPHASIRSAK